MFFLKYYIYCIIILFFKIKIFQGNHSLTFLLILNYYLLDMHDIHV